MPTGLENERQLIVDHTSAHGPTVTHMRGTMVIGSVENLRELGLYERYFELLAPEHQEPIKFCLASSWVPVELGVAHYDACDRLELDDEQRRKLGEMMAKRVAATFMSSMLRITRNAGLEALEMGVSQIDRLWDRMYQGGGVRVIRTGPKDAILENFGLPLVQSRHWRTAYAAYLKALLGMFAKTVYLRQVHPQTPGPNTIAFSGSWV